MLRFLCFSGLRARLKFFFKKKVSIFKFAPITVRKMMQSIISQSFEINLLCAMV